MSENITKAVEALQSRYDLAYEIEADSVCLTGYMTIGAISFSGTCRVSRSFLEPYQAEFIERTLAEKLAELYKAMVDGAFHDYGLATFSTDLVSEISMTGVR